MSEQEVSEEISVVSIFEESFGILTKNFGKLLGAAAVPYLAAFAGATVLAATFGFDTAHQNPLYSLASSVFFMVAAIIAQATICYAAIELKDGREIQLSNAYRRATDRLFPILGYSFLMGLSLCLAALFLLVPALVVMVMLILVVPVAVMEPGVNALARSSELTKGHRWTMAGLLLVNLILVWGLMLPTKMLFGFGFMDQSYAATMTTYVVGLPISLLYYVAIPVAYVKLRNAKAKAAASKATP